ncbi:MULTISPECIES: site-specific integrase [unclassified Thiomonas]|jgi:integrase|uniref:site-specific integrase n=1 Tax=unclassified Thiomonas TaxID=2625466 RepID=UPI000BCA8936|nr:MULTISPECIES: site-specific integrase [unclassified Thiomonas]OZB69556.1 MAG: integrase [Thiomonas sp. 13-64-67]
MKNYNTKTDVPSSALTIRLPETAFTRSGIAFCPNDDVWTWTDGPFRLVLDFRKIKVNSPTLIEGLKHTLLIFAKGSSTNHLGNLFQAFTHFLANRKETTPLTDITAQEVSNYSAGLKAHEKGRLGTLNVLLQKWGALRLDGVEPECIRYLRERRKPGNEKGAAVRTRNPVEGPFSEAEYTALYKAVDAAYGAGELALWFVILTRLLFACGGRISQYASLKVKDFRADGSAFALGLPQVKTREAHARMSFKVFDLSPQTGRLLTEYIGRLKAEGHDADAALFPEAEVMMKGSQKTLRPEGDMYFGHCTSQALSRVFSTAIGSIAPPSDRLDFEPIPVNPRRFRYTFGTRLAEEGASKIVIADRLGHTDLQNVDVYFEASPKIIENIDNAMDAQLAPLANAFRGRLVEDEEHSTHKGAPGSRIIDFRVSKNPVGSCGGKGQGCEFNKPVACYTCFKFEPWLDAPHEKILQRLTKERSGFSNDDRMSAVNDDAILAVRQVMAECAQVYEQRKSEASA